MKTSNPNCNNCKHYKPIKSGPYYELFSHGKGKILTRNLSGDLVYFQRDISPWVLIAAAVPFFGTVFILGYFIFRNRFYMEEKEE